MPVCSAPGCTAPAVVQWTRHASDDETADHGERLRAARQQFVDEHRARLLAQISDIETVRDRMTESKRASVADLRVWSQQIAAATAERDALTDVEPIDPGPTVIAVFGCEGHAVDPEAAALVHDVECMTHGPCACDVSPA